MTVKETTFNELKEKFKEEDKEVIIFYGCGGELSGWVDFITPDLKKNGIVPMTFSGEWHTFETEYKPGHMRTELIMELDDRVDVGRLAIWRLRFGDCGWFMTDYIHNYAEQNMTEEEFNEYQLLMMEE